MILRLKKWMQSQSIKPSELADQINVSRSSISHIFSSRNKPSIEFLQKLLSAYPNISANWLICGTGSMYINDYRLQSPRNINKVLVFFDDNSFRELKS